MLFAPRIQDDHEFLEGTHAELIKWLVMFGLR